MHLLLVVLGATSWEDAVGGLSTHTAVTGGAYGRSAVTGDGVVTELLVDREALHGERGVILGHVEDDCCVATLCVAKVV